LGSNSSTIIICRRRRRRRRRRERGREGEKEEGGNAQSYLKLKTCVASPGVGEHESTVQDVTQSSCDRN